MGAIISKKLATLRELQEYYGYEDALNLAEIIQVNNYNEQVAVDIAGEVNNRNGSYR